MTAVGDADGIRVGGRIKAKPVERIDTTASLGPRETAANPTRPSPLPPPRRAAERMVRPWPPGMTQHPSTPSLTAVSRLDGENCEVMPSTA